jgi:hypothetical protein
VSRPRNLIFWPVQVRRDREHTWKNHCRSGLTRELLGIVDKMAAREEVKSGYRFVYASLDALLALCFKGLRKEERHYSIRQLKYVFEELREQHIFSRYFEHDSRVGFVVAPHDSLCRSDGKTCLLPNRGAWQFVDQKPVWQSKLISALLVHSKLPRECTVNCTESAPKTAPIGEIKCTDDCTQNCTDQPKYLANLALVSDEEKADWLASDMKNGEPIRSIPSSIVSEHPNNPTIRSVQDKIKQHHEFLENHKAKKQRQKQQHEETQKQSEHVSSFKAKPKTAEATAAPTPIVSRKRPVLTEEEFLGVKDREQTERSLEEWKAEIAARAACPKCGVKHLGDCKGEPFKRKS